MVEFRNTPPRAPIPHRSNDALVEDLCLALRAVGVNEVWSPTQEAVAEAVAIADELDARGVIVVERLNRLTEETGWLMPKLLEDCRRSPETHPHVTELDGVRRALRCRYCRAAERPESDARYYACDQCLGALIHSFESLVAVEGTVLFRTYNVDWRCAHADADTVVLGINDNDYEGGMSAAGDCKRCLQDAARLRQVARDHAS
jgi:hypothetical protein